MLHTSPHPEITISYWIPSQPLLAPLCYIHLRWPLDLAPPLPVTRISHNLYHHLQNFWNKNVWPQLTLRPGKIFEQKRIFSSTPLLCLYFARFMGLVKKQHLSFFHKIINSLEIFPKNYFNKTIGNWKYIFFVNFRGKLISSVLSAEACHGALFFLIGDGCF